MVPRAIIRRYVTDPSLRARAAELVRAGKWVNPIFMKGDFTFNRWLRMVHTHLQHFGLYKRYYR